MLITIYDSAGNPKVDLSPNDSSTHVEEVQGDSVLTLSFTHYEHIGLDVDDYADFLGKRFWLTEKYKPRQNSRKEWVYDIKLYGVESLLRNILVINMVDGEDEPVFTLTAPPREHVAMIVRCMNDGMGGISDWKVGRVDGTGNIVIDYFGKYCDEALKEIAEKIGTEWWVEGQTVNLCRCEHGEPVVLGYGKGLLSIDPDRADNVKFYTRLYPVGSSRNIDPEKYGHSRLQLPDGRKYVEVNADKYGRVDHYEESAFGEIYPKRVGVVSSVRSEERTGEDGNPFTVYYFKDDGMTFDPNEYDIPGLVKRVSFQEGSELAGLGDEEDGTYFFEVNFDSKTKEFEIITTWPYKDSGQQLPGGSLVPKSGDEYILWNLRMPDEYYDFAEQEFLAAVEQYNEEHGLDITVFKSSTDHVWIEDNEVELSIGRRVRLESEEYFHEGGFRESRITKITRKVNLPSSMDIEIGDALGRSARQKFTDDINDARSYARSMSESVAMPDIIRMGDKTAPTDNNLFSARRTLDEALSRKRPDQARGLKSFLDGMEVGDFATGIKGAEITASGDAEVESLSVRKGASVGSDLAVGRRISLGNYVPGVSGGVFYIDENGEAHLETSELTVNKKLMAKEVEVQEQTWVGGAQVISPAGMVCERVEQVPPAPSTPGVVVLLTGYKCLFRTMDADGRRVNNQFRVGDLARCETFNLIDVDGYQTNRYYWREVTEVGYETDSNGDEWGYAVLSALWGKYDPASTCAPEAGDSIVTVGNTTDPERRNLIIQASYGEGSPYLYQFEGIDSFSLSKDKLKTRISPDGNLFTGRFLIEAEGRDPEYVEDYIDRQKPYSLRPSTRSVLVYHAEDPDTGESVPKFSPRTISCDVVKATGSGQAQVLASPYGDNIKVVMVVRRYDPESGTSVDYPSEAYAGAEISPEEDMRSVTFYLLIDEVMADKAAVSVQADATALDSEYRTSLEVTGRAIAMQADKINEVEKQVGSLTVTAEEITGKVSKLSSNLAGLPGGEWIAYPEGLFSISQLTGGARFFASGDVSGLTTLLFRTKVDSTRFKPDTDYVLTAGLYISGGAGTSSMTIRAAVCNGPSTVFLVPYTPSEEKMTDSNDRNARYTFRMRSANTIPTEQMWLHIYLNPPEGFNLNRYTITVDEAKLEEGVVATRFIPVGEDYDSVISQQADEIAMSVKVDGVERAGLTLDAEEGITLQAEKVRITNGDSVAALFTDGILNASLIEVNRLATKAGGKTRVTIGEFDDAFIRFYHEDGITLAMKLGLDYVSLEENATLQPLSEATPAASGLEASTLDSAVAIPIFQQGKPAMAQVYDTDGNLTWVLFLDGPVTPDTQPYSWRTYSLVRQTLQNMAAIQSNQTLRAEEYWRFRVKSGVTSDYSPYRDRFFRKKMSDADFTAATSYYVYDGRYYFPSPELQAASVSDPQMVWIRRYYDIQNGALTGTGFITL